LILSSNELFGFNSILADTHLAHLVLPDTKPTLGKPKEPLFSNTFNDDLKEVKTFSRKYFT
jgi:hypothetical protein